MVNITNDAWFGNSTGPRQHLAAARMRAVEEGLPLFRAANTGISVAFDCRGHEVGRLAMNIAGDAGAADSRRASADVVFTMGSGDSGVVVSAVAGDWD